MGNRIVCPCTEGPSPATEALWREEQDALKRRLVLEDVHPDWGIGDAAATARPPPPRFVGGCDISFVKDSAVDALAMVVVLSFPELEVVHTVSAMIELTAPCE